MSREEDLVKAIDDFFIMAKTEKVEHLSALKQRTLTIRPTINAALSFVYDQYGAHITLFISDGSSFEIFIDLRAPYCDGKEFARFYFRKFDADNMFKISKEKFLEMILDDKELAEFMLWNIIWKYT